MSRSYRIRLSETARRTIVAEDHVSCQLELIQVLPAEQMSALLADELAAAGFAVEDGTATCTQDDVAISVDLASGAVRIEARDEQDVEITEQGSTLAAEEIHQSSKAKLRDELREKIDEQASLHTNQLQSEVTKKLAAALGDVRRDLDRVANRVIAEALKRKAAQLGRIKETTGDPESGALTIVVEV